MPPKIDDPEDLKRLQDYGAELASLRADYDKAKVGSAKHDALQAEIEKLKGAIDALASKSPRVGDAIADNWAGFWAGLLQDDVSQQKPA